MKSLDPESAARRYVDAMVTGAPAMTTAATAPATPTAAAELKSLGIDRIPFTGNQHVKFRQYVHKIPVYGSLVSVELDGDNGFVSINTTMGDPGTVNPVADLSPQAVLKKVAKWAGYGKAELKQQPRPHFYFDAGQSSWRLVYLVEDVLRMKPRAAAKADSVATLPEVSDFVVDAHNGELVAELPRTQTIDDGRENATDGLGTTRDIGFILDSQLKRLHDRKRNVRTYDFNFRDAFFQNGSLPGDLVINPPAPWDGGAVSAHANAGAVMDFLRDVLQRDGLDGAGGAVISTINCVYQGNGSKEWRNAARFRGQMVYGQRMVSGVMRSYALSLDVVAHELLHGLTENTARLEYRMESGALNKSYSDIFGVIVSNLHLPSVDDWNWEIGEHLSETGLPLRDMSDPARFDQPAHMDDYRELPETEDHGGVHINSGIHNKAAFNVLTAPSDTDNKLFLPADVARLYYLSLLAHLSRTSTFSDSRAGLILAAQSIFAADPNKQAKIAAIEKGYHDVGID